MKILPFVVVSLLAACSSPQKASINPQSGVITGTLDQNLLQIAGKPVATTADGVQSISLVPNQLSQDPCDGNAGLNFNKATTSTTTVQLIPPMAGQSAFICSIHVHGNFDAKTNEVISLIEGGGTLCAASPTYLEGDAQPADGVLIAGGGNGGFIQGGAGATIYKTTGPNRGICVKAGGNNRVSFSGTYIYK